MLASIRATTRRWHFQLFAVAGFGIATQDHTVFLGALDRAGIGGSDDDRIGAQRGVGRQAEHVIDPSFLAEGHDLWSAIVPVTPDGDVRLGPVATKLANETPNVSGRLNARWCLAGAQQHRHRPPCRGIVDMDRQEAAFAVVTVPERELLVAVHDVAGVINIQRHGLGRYRIAGTVNADHLGHHARQLARGWRILPPTHCRLTGKARPGARQLAQRQAEARIVAQSIEVVGIFVAAADRQNPRP
jgi:hypothetical protein